MGVMDKIWEKAKKKKKNILLPEAMDARMLKAARDVMDQGYANISLIGNEDEINALAEENNVDLAGINIVNPLTDSKRGEYVQAFTEMRKSKGMTTEKAEAILKDSIYYASMMVKLGDGDGMVAGAASSTPEVWRPVLQIVKTKPGISVASSCFIMEVPNCKYGADGLFIFADCGLNPNPNEDQLAAIAVSAADLATSLLEIEPNVALLSFSTKGSANDPLVDKVVNATNIAKTMRPDLNIDGELQGDAALDAVVGASKAPNSPVAGKANVLIFPDLNAGNINYKLVQRLANAMALGPLSMGLAKPVNDLSRGCSVQDIVNVVAITAVEAQNQ
jgi:phosphate acetyltransferase